MISQKLLNTFPAWWADIPTHPDAYYLVMSDDMDSYFSCRYLNKSFGVEIGGFYDFRKGLFLTDKAANSGKTAVYVDLSITEGFTFDNHRSIFTSNFAVNPNNVIDPMDDKTYSQKYCGGTFLLIAALYNDIPNAYGTIAEMSELQKAYLLAIDSFYIGYYNNGGKYRHINIDWLDRLGVKDALLPVLENHDIQYFSNLLLEEQLKEPIRIRNDGTLFSVPRFEMPKDVFRLVQPVIETKLSKSEILNLSVSDFKQIFAASETWNKSYILCKIA